MTILITKPGGGSASDTTANTQNLVPYVGASSDVNLGAKHLTVTGLTSTALEIGTLNGVLSGTTGAISSIGTSTTAEFLRGDLTWAAPAGGGDVTTAISGATDNTMVVWSGTSGTSVGTTNVIGLVTLSTPGVVASMTTGQITVVSPLAKDNVTQTLGNSLEISIDTSNFFHSATTGALTATTPITVGACQVLGAAAVIEINTANMVPYVGATSDLNLGTKHITATGVTSTSLKVGTLAGVLQATAGLLSAITTGAVSATTPISVTAGRQALGGAMAISIDTANMVPYVGAQSNLNLATKHLIATGITATNLTTSADVKATGQVVANGLTANTAKIGTLAGPIQATAGVLSALTTGVVSATVPLSVTASRQVLGGTMAISIATGNMAVYVGATSNMNLGARHLIATGVTATNLYVSGSVVAPGISTLHSKSIVIDVPSETADYPIWKVPYAITIRRVAVLCTGAASATIVGFLDECDANGAGASIVSADATAISGTDKVTTTFTNAGIDANDYIRWHTTSTSGVLASATITMDYTVN